MKRRMSIKKRAAMVAATAATAAAASLFVASPALAYNDQCDSYFLGTVSFSLCVGQASATSAYAYVKVLSGSYISGTLYLEDPAGAQGSCSGKHYPVSTCYGPTVNAGHGIYEAEWYSAGGTVYDGAYIYI